LDTVAADALNVVGSIVQVPVAPDSAAVVMMALPPILTVLPEVSIAPPLPPWGALASSVPLTVVTPPCVSARRLITPFWLLRVWAWMTPLLLTADRSRALAAWAVINTRPPSAMITPPFSARAFSAPVSTVTPSRPLPARSRVTPFPAASTTVPSIAEIRPLLATWPPRRATNPPWALIAPVFITAASLVPAKL